jgi:hypothetical protein
MHTVHWLQSALDELTDIWVQADSAVRYAITDASHQLESVLQKDPQNEGESRYGASRITFMPPLIATFQIEADGVSVTILQIRLLKKRKK